MTRTATELNASASGTGVVGGMRHSIHGSWPSTPAQSPTSVTWTAEDETVHPVGLLAVPSARAPRQSAVARSPTFAADPNCTSTVIVPPENARAGEYTRS